MNSRVIELNNADNWELVSSVNKEAVVIGSNSTLPIEPFMIEAEIDSPFLTVAVFSSTAKTSWSYAGELIQVYQFASAISVNLTDVYLPAHKLYLNRNQVIFTQELSESPFKLYYSVPSWFKDFQLEVYKYVGAVTLNNDLVSSLELSLTKSLNQDTDCSLCTLLEKLEAIEAKLDGYEPSEPEPVGEEPEPPNEEPPSEEPEEPIEEPVDEEPEPVGEEPIGEEPIGEERPDLQPGNEADLIVLI